jgi:Zn-dependent protease with chaperone function
MMALAGFLFQCAAIAALVAVAVGAWVGLLVWLARPLVGRLSAAAQADVWLLAALLPAMAAVSMAVATAAPSFATALGLGPDHCPGHGHHFHVCFVHAADVTPGLVTLGVVALAVWLYRTTVLVAGLARSHRAVNLLARLGKPRAGAFPVLVVPGRELCHATGIRQRRVMVSSDLVARLSPDELTGALAHEEAHLRRRDPLANCLLGLAATFLPPPLGQWLRARHRFSAEAACDGAAAAVVGSPAVIATALVKAASLQRSVSSATGFPAFGVHELEIRVRALLDGQVTHRQSHWCLGAGAIAGSFVVAICALTEPMHHLSETILGRIL